MLGSLATGFAGLAAGRLLSGIGAVLLSVPLSKMVTDWFAGREIVLAMAIFMNSFPIGIGLAVLVLGGLAGAAGWPAVIASGAGPALAALALLLLAYRPHPNERAGPAAAGTWRIPRLDVALVCIAGALWGILNGAFAIMVGFAPSYLGAAGLGRGRDRPADRGGDLAGGGLGPGGRDAGAALGPAGAAADHRRARLGGLPAGAGDAHRAARLGDARVRAGDGAAGRRHHGAALPGAAAGGSGARDGAVLPLALCRAMPGCRRWPAGCRTAPAARRRRSG